MNSQFAEARIIFPFRQYCQAVILMSAENPKPTVV